MVKRTKKDKLRAGDDLVKRLAAKEKQRQLVQDVLPPELADDQHYVAKLLRGNRRDAKWNPASKERA